MCSQSDETKNEESEWVRQQLTGLFGHNKAEYFLKPSEITHENESSKEHMSINGGVHSKKNRNGMFAHMIWDNIRSDSKKKAKILSKKFR